MSRRIHAALWLLYEKTHERRYRDYVQTFVDRWIDARPFPIGNTPNDPRVQDTMQRANLLFGLYADLKDERYLKAMHNARQVFFDALDPV